MLLAKGWYLFSAGGAVFLLPYLYPFISSRGFSDPQIGLLAAVRPWLAAVAAMTGPALADRFNCHRAMMVATFLASILLRASIYYAAEAQYLLLFTVVIVSEYLAAPPNVLADAAVVALCSRGQEGASYGRQRLWGSIGWGGLSFLAGVLLDSCGYGSGFLVYLILSAPCIYVLARFRYGSSSGGGSSSSSSGGGDKGGGGSSRRGGKAARGAVEEEEEGPAVHAAGGGEEEEATYGEAQLSAWPAPPGGMLHEEALLPHAHEPFPFIRTLVRTISGLPPSASPPGRPQPRRRRPASPPPQPLCSTKGGCGGAYQQPGGLVGPAAHLPPPDLMHLATPFGYEEAQHPRVGGAATLPVAAEAAEESGMPPTASDGSSHGGYGGYGGGGGGVQRYSMMKLSSSVETWIQRSETWIRQRECERSAAAAEMDGGGGVVRAGACLGSPSVSGRCGCGFERAAGVAARGDGERDGEEGDLLLGRVAGVQPVASVPASGGATQHHVHLVATIRDPRPAATAAAGAGPAASYHIHVSAAGAAAGAIPLGAQLKMGSATTLESVTLGSTAATDPSTPACGGNGQRQQCSRKAATGGSGHSGADGDGGGFLVRAGRLLSDGAVWLFLAKVFLLGFGTGTIGTWLFIYVSSLGASHALQGLMLTMNCVAEVPVFFFQEAVTRRFPAGAVLHVATGSLVLRLAAYVALPSLPSPWFVLPVELMQGLTFALSWGTCCVHCKAIAPESLQATMQGLWQAMFNGLASGAGGLVGAVLHDRLGGRAMFAITAGLILVGWLLLAAAEGLAALVAARRRRRAGSDPSDECVHLMRGQEDSGRRGGGSGSGGRCAGQCTQQCEVVVAAVHEKRALLAGTPQLSVPAALGRAGSGRGQAARALGQAAGASVSSVLRLALAGAWRHGFHAASAAAAATASSTAAAAPSQQGYSACSNAAAGPPSYDQVADDMTHGGLLYGFFSRRRMGSIAGSLSGPVSGGGAGSGASSPKQGFLPGGDTGGGSRRSMHARGGSAVALTPEALAANAGASGGLERSSSDVAFDGGRDQGPQQEELAVAGVAQGGGAAPAAAAACSAGASGGSGGSGGSAFSSGSSGMLDALSALAAAAASPPILPASPAAAGSIGSWQ
ncbi:hypothetical protein HYH02_002299 [Chlamydomonas schloesseri]|uniref:Major facilitator superfamily associated domain-containing protein n=1 Tax=Chlamydomonas schloesseri TaxID=2026947 RepID=A0A836BAT7_9CHLO|nr:hypothetical protein HYH02_002299 [Chlamydomonas schloesseri]|eukprot:KAG2452962.1 hypothetical protein HYH02_002299 [Chlamydomonas schloesseri]